MPKKRKSMDVETVRADIEALMPKDTIMRGAWASCLRWALGNEEIRKEFEKETGCGYSAPRSTIDAMIDEATGHTAHYISAFVPWFNLNVWGEQDGKAIDRY